MPRSDNEITWGVVLGIAAVIGLLGFVVGDMAGQYEATATFENGANATGCHLECDSFPSMVKDPYITRNVTCELQDGKLVCAGYCDEQRRRLR